MGRRRKIFQRWRRGSDQRVGIPSASATGLAKPAALPMPSCKAGCAIDGSGAPPATAFYSSVTSRAKRSGGRGGQQPDAMHDEGSLRAVPVPACESRHRRDLQVRIFLLQPVSAAVRSRLRQPASAARAEQRARKNFQRLVKPCERSAIVYQGG